MILTTIEDPGRYAAHPEPTEDRWLEPKTSANSLPRSDLFAVGDVVEITAACMTTGKQGVIAAYQFGKWEVSFSPQWCGWYLPEQIRKIA
jgi:hypothetical protein